MSAAMSFMRRLTVLEVEIFIIYFAVFSPSILRTVSRQHGATKLSAMVRGCLHCATS